MVFVLCYDLIGWICVVALQDLKERDQGLVIGMDIVLDQEGLLVNLAVRREELQLIISLLSG